jgi:LacI family transcriptional regulator
LTKRGVPFYDEHVITLEHGWDSFVSSEVRTTLHAYLKQQGTLAVTALFAINDFVAFIAVHTLQEHGYAVPDDIAVVGFDNTFFAYETRPQLTSVAQPVAEITRLAMERLLERMSDRSIDQPSKIVLEPTLVVRDSTRRMKILS